jgi:hypothetical protein
MFATLFSGSDDVIFVLSQAIIDGGDALFFISRVLLNV